MKGCWEPYVYNPITPDDGMTSDYEKLAVNKLVDSFPAKLATNRSVTIEDPFIEN